MLLSCIMDGDVASYSLHSSCISIPGRFCQGWARRPDLVRAEDNDGCRRKASFPVPPYCILHNTKGTPGTPEGRLRCRSYGRGSWLGAWFSAISEIGALLPYG